MLLDLLEEVVDAGVIRRSDVLPSAWAEGRRVMGSAESKFRGPFRYDLTPYAREIVDCLSPGHPAQQIWVMKGAQVGISKGVIENGINYVISEHPANILYLVGHSDLVKKAGAKLDLAIDGCGNRGLIRPTAMRRKGTKSGDTDFIKDFAGGSLYMGTASNHKTIRQADIMYGFYDDYEAARGASKESGDTTELILQRHASFGGDMKAMFLSTPEVASGSLIEEGYLTGDQRRFYIPCPCCGVLITLEWSWSVETNVGLRHGVGMPADWYPANGNTTAGMYWKVDDGGHLVAGSVGYVCQACGGFFDDREKGDWLRAGLYMPTGVAVGPEVVSFHISSLYAPPGMKGWEGYVRQYLAACPPGLPKKRSKFQTFVNLALGMSYEETEEAPEAKLLQRNVRGYDIGVVPDGLSVADGNGRIVMLTLAADMNGLVKDARLDWEVRAWSERGASYSVAKGSIGTFVPLEGRKRETAPRRKWTYEHGKANSVWPELTRVIDGVYMTDRGQKRGVMLAGIDCGHYSKYAYEYLDETPAHVIGLRGDKGDVALPEGRDVPWYKPGRERADYWLLDVNRIKDRLSEYMGLTWEEGVDEYQGAGFMNFPTPGGGLYGWGDYFEHFEAEHRVLAAASGGGGVRAVWQKKNSVAQNHFWDIAVYQLALRELHLHLEAKRMKAKGLTWGEYAAAVVGLLPELPKVK